MHEIHLPEHLYKRATQAAASNSQSVDQFVTLALESYFGEQEGLDSLFTPEVLKAIDRGVEDVRAGRVKPIEDVIRERNLAREEWRRNHAS